MSTQHRPMTADDIGRVLAKAAAFDRRTVGEGDILAWFDAIGDVDPEDALEAVTAHYRQTDAWLMPAHVLRHVEQTRRERARAAITAARQATPCRHGDPGGILATGEPMCPRCRAQRRLSAIIGGNDWSAGRLGHDNVPWASIDEKPVNPQCTEGDAR